MSRRRVTWAEAEKICPGIEAEWRSMLGQEGTLVPPMHPDWKLDVYDHFGPPDKDPAWMIEITMVTEEPWYMPPCWRRWPDGGWTHPYAMRHDPLDSPLFRSDFLEYKYKEKK